MYKGSSLRASAGIAPTAKKTNANRLTSIFKSSIGNLLGWYDWYVYAVLAIYLSSAFFPVTGDDNTRMLMLFSAFAASHVMRPVGSWLLGEYADRKGRKAALKVSVLLMCAGSLVIALAPDYETIGVAAPYLLVLGRLLHGLAIGGENAITATYLYEMASKGRRGFFTNLQSITLIFGLLISSLLVKALNDTLSSEDMRAWGWRVPFVIGALFSMVAFYLRSGLEETESFTNNKALKESPLKTLMGQSEKLRAVAGLTIGGALATYTYAVYMPKYLFRSFSISHDERSALMIAIPLSFMFLQLLIGGLSDRIGRRPILIAFGVLGTLFTVPILITMHTVQTWWGALFLIMAALVIVSCFTSTITVVIADLFPTEIRAIGVGLPYALNVAVIFATAEPIALLFKRNGMESGFYWFVTAGILYSLLVYLTMKETKTHSRITTD
ncbi:MFS transporter [Pseudomonas sp. BP8]|uniref:MFS transporter n=1 Tax=Pseudomonas sp. BP8 TaxID=2817864 RepID=UPI001AE6E1D3|nr:MFS transporter [Pseudomonas sp. BP8]MBP2264039.1 MHS family alpha-ketoglutarate permease-like MFS transporter [Pseudomonas sp. BP8]HDS1734052.1 MFS transporter [Pseudomonas putida]